MKLSTDLMEALYCVCSILSDYNWFLEPLIPLVKVIIELPLYQLRVRTVRVPSIIMIQTNNVSVLCLKIYNNYQVPFSLKNMIFSSFQPYIS